MTRLLVSVRSLEEALIACGAGADIIDLKDPGRGALAPVDPATMDAVAQALPGVDVSAVIGELPDEAGSLERNLESGVQAELAYFKVGIAGAGPAHADLVRLAKLALAGHRIVAVFYAESLPEREVVERCSQAGVAVAMLDTRDKAGLSLPELANRHALTAFISAARAAGMQAGLAGRLRLPHLENLLDLGPDVIGMRGGLCVDDDRRVGLDAAKVERAASIVRARALAPPVVRIC